VSSFVVVISLLISVYYSNMQYQWPNPVISLNCIYLDILLKGLRL